MVSDTSFEQKTRIFFEGAKQGLDVLRPATVECDRHLARKFNFFNSIAFFDSISRKREDRVSDVFAYLLDPNETHGQGELFLREFLSDIHVEWLPENGWSRIHVSREVLTTRIESWKCRIDIEIAFRIDDGWAAIAIENKLWAEDQNQQISNYARHLEKMYKGHFKLIYLTSDGEHPSLTSICLKEREKLEDAGKLDYVSIWYWVSDNGWLKRAEDKVKAERVRWFVSDFRKALIESLQQE